MTKREKRSTREKRKSRKEDGVRTGRDEILEGGREW